MFRPSSRFAASRIDTQIIGKFEMAGIVLTLGHMVLGLSLASSTLPAVVDELIFYFTFFE